ncbi:MAG TPA: hypothetical protein VIM60_00680 [Edaphobacter sp.]
MHLTSPRMVYFLILLDWIATPAFCVFLVLFMLAFVLTRRAPEKAWLAVTTVVVGMAAGLTLCGLEAAAYSYLTSTAPIYPAAATGSGAFIKLGKGYDLQMGEDWSSCYLLHDPAWNGEGLFPERYNVTRLQIAGDLILGESGIHGSEGSFFLLDAENGTMKTADSMAALRSLSASSGVTLALQPAKTIYSNYRKGRIVLPLACLLGTTSIITICAILLVSWSLGKPRRV